MPKENDIRRWTDIIRERYENYLKTSFYFKDPDLRASFQSALQGDNLLKGPIPDPGISFKTGVSAQALAKEYFPQKSDDLLPALRENALYLHQEHAIRLAYHEQKNIVVATGTASGKTESFLYPIIFELYKQHLEGKLGDAGVRAMILYPMNALANDQRERLGEICKQLSDAGSAFSPTFGQYTGQTPEDITDKSRNGRARAEEALQNELVFRTQMRITPPHILLTNYSMLEYLLIRPDDSRLFDGGRGKYWQFIVLDEAHQYRGTKGMEMGMLIRRLKQRLRDGGRENPFRCIATSATLTSGTGSKEKKAIADFAQELFCESYEGKNIIFGKHEAQNEHDQPRRYHLFLRALEGAFLVHSKGKDTVRLNRKIFPEEGPDTIPMEIALCKECGQHYYVGRKKEGKLVEAIRDPSQPEFGVEYYLPVALDASDTTATKDNIYYLCRRCGAISSDQMSCKCHAQISVKKCAPDKRHPDQLEKCETCSYARGGIGDPVQEIIHGSDGPNAVIATALHELLPENGRKVLAFADSRQEAAFFAWYAEDSYNKLRDRNFILRALRNGDIASEGLSVDDLKNRLIKQWEQAGLFSSSASPEAKNRKALKTIYTEMLTTERRISLAGVGLVKWSVKIPDNFPLPKFGQEPWNLKDVKTRTLIAYLLDEMRRQRAVALPNTEEAPRWDKITWLPQQSFCLGTSGKRKYVREWGNKQSIIVKHYLDQLLLNNDVPSNERRKIAVQLMGKMWESIRDHDTTTTREKDRMLLRADNNATFRLNYEWLRVTLADPNELWECNICAGLSPYNIHSICPRGNCPGELKLVNLARLNENHYRNLYQSNLPPLLNSAEHTAQINPNEARRRQDEFKDGTIHLLSSSTTFEVGVDLGDLEAVFLRNVPPEPFNYTQRVGRAGRRETPGLTVTYCRQNPHDLYHYRNPEERMIKGKVHPPKLRMTNTKIISRHMVAVALSAFFRSQGNQHKLKNVKALMEDLEHPRAILDLEEFCKNNKDIANSLYQIVPKDIREKTGLNCDDWINHIVGPDSHFAQIEAEICGDYCSMKTLLDTLLKERPTSWTTKAKRLENRMKTIEREKTTTFLSRKAVIPKYGFPVDVVELDTRAEQAKQVSLQRDLSQAIAEYAPGCKVVADKLEWESCGVKVVPGKYFPIKYYSYDSAHSFQQHNENGTGKKYLSPIFGFITPLFKNPKEPHSRTQHLYTTRPFFPGFDKEPSVRDILGIKITKASPGNLVILCEGHNKEGFHICLSCGYGKHPDQIGTHKTPAGLDCPGTLQPFSLGHELVTDVVRLQFQGLMEEWDAYSLAYAMLLGMAETMDVPDTDLNITVAGSRGQNGIAIILYDNVPGGAGLVAQLDQEGVFQKVLDNARKRVEGGCGCDSSCYGCLRSYRNQFAHPYLNRKKALEFLDASINSNCRS